MHCIDVEHDQRVCLISDRLVLATQPLFDEILETASNLISVVFCLDVFCKFLVASHVGIWLI